jgi:hypothetical protein
LDLEDTQIGLPLLEPIQRIMIGTEHGPPLRGGYVRLKLN